MLVAHLTLQRANREPVDLGVVGISENSPADASIANFKVTCSFINGDKINTDIRGFARTGGLYALMARGLEELQQVISKQLDAEKEQLNKQVYPNFCTALRTIEGASYSKQCGEEALPGQHYCSDHIPL